MNRREPRRKRATCGLTDVLSVASARNVALRSRSHESLNSSLYELACAELVVGHNEETRVQEEIH